MTKYRFAVDGDDVDRVANTDGLEVIAVGLDLFGDEEVAAVVAAMVLDLLVRHAARHARLLAGDARHLVELVARVRRQPDAGDKAEHEMTHLHEWDRITGSELPGERRVKHRASGPAHRLHRFLGRLTRNIDEPHKPSIPVALRIAIASRRS